MKIRDTLERVFWTFVSSALSSVIGAALLDMNTWKTAALAGLTAAINLVTVIARQRLAVLPNPGDGLPGLPTNNGSP